MNSAMEAVTYRTDVFTQEPGAVIYERRKGIGRLIHALCDRYLFAGAIANAAQIDDRLVQRVGQVI